MYGVFDELLQKVGRLGVLLKDPEVSSVRLVLNPDRIAIAETRRSFTYFGLFGFPLDGVFVNKVMPQALAEGYLHDWYTLQEELLDTIDRSFLEVPRFHVPLLDREPIGLGPLSEMARGIFGERAPDELLAEPRPVAIDRVDGKYQLKFWLPTAEKRELDLGRKGTDLILSAGTYSRVFSLPDTLVGHEIASADFNEGRLTLTFD